VTKLPDAGQEYEMRISSNSGLPLNRLSQEQPDYGVAVGKLPYSAVLLSRENREG